MFAPKMARPQTKAPESSTSKLVTRDLTLAGHRWGHNPVDDGRTSADSACRGISWSFSKISIFPPERTSEAQLVSVHSTQPGRIQPKLAIGPVDDPLEREADAIAGAVMRMPEPAPSISAAAIQASRKCALCEKDDEQNTLQKKSADGTQPQTVPLIVHEVLRSPGQPLGAATRAFFEQRFGYDFSRVKVHTDGRAAASAHAIGARGYAAGEHIVFGAVDKLESETGRHFLAHELTHTIQQGASRRLGGVGRRLDISASHRSIRRQTPEGGTEEGQHLETPCRETSRLTSPEHQLIQSDYQTQINENSAREYAIPESAKNGIDQGYADLVDLTTYAIYDIKNPSDDLGESKQQVLRYRTKAEEHCDDKAPWHVGTEYKSPRIVKSSDPGIDLVVENIYPGILQYSRRVRGDQPANSVPPEIGAAMAKLASARDLLRNRINLYSGEHKAELDLIEKPSVTGFIGYVSSQLAGGNPPPVVIWVNAFGALAALDGALRRMDFMGATASIGRAHIAYVEALKQYIIWKSGVEAAAEQIKKTAEYTAIAAGAILAVAGAVVAFPAVAEALGLAGAGAASTTAATTEAAAATEASAAAGGQVLARVGQLMEQAEAAESEQLEEIIEELRTLRR
jgi:Domain of unknown function (DUF4157)